jgi:hypothetical protein
MSIRPVVLLLALLATMVVIGYNAASAPSPDFTEEVITVAKTDFYHTWQNTREGKTLGRV